MDKFTPYSKMSKSKQKEINNRKRKMWSINPTTRKTENKKAYNRKKARNDMKDYLNNSESCCYQWTVVSAHGGGTFA